MMVSMSPEADVHVARAERLALCDTFLAVGPDAPTLCSPWRTRDLAAHLVVRERRPDLAPGIFVPFLAARTEREQSRIAAGSWPELVETVRSGPPSWLPMRFSAVDDLVNTVEMVVHHEDVLRGDGAVGPRRELDERTGKAVWAALKRVAPLAFRKAPVGVRLVAPGRSAVEATTKAGAGVVTVTGEPLELLLLAYGRHQVAAVEYAGSDADIAALKGASLGI